MKNDPPPQKQDYQLEALRTILLAKEQEHLARLEEGLKELGKKASLGDQQLGEALDELRRQHEDTQALIERIAPSMPGMVRKTIRVSGAEIAETMGPFMGEAIRGQIRDSRDEMADALSPVMGAAIQKALIRFSSELQRNVDARLKSTFGPEGALRIVIARLRGVSPSEMTLRGALPFTVKEIFLIQRASGILIGHSHHTNTENDDSDLVSGMLTAIRSFAADAFKGQDELDEIQFGGDQIVIQAGAHAYLAAAVSGTQPEGFRSKLSEFIVSLHLRSNNALRDFNGDPADLPNFQPQLAQLVSGFEQSDEKKPLTRQQKTGYALAGMAAWLFLTLVCFYVWFTFRLLPVAFPQPTPTATITMTLTMTSSPTPLPANTPTYTPTRTVTPYPTLTQITTVDGVTTGNVWVHSFPGANSPIVHLLFQNTHVHVIAVDNNWLKVSWTGESGLPREGWVLAKWVSIEGPFSSGIVTPFP